jgi:choline dehydrogenase
VLGGSSSINGMVYVRGHARDFDHWKEEGRGRLGLCRRASLLQAHGECRRRRAGWRGTDGPMNVRRGALKNPLYKAFIEAGGQAGFELTDDYNGSKQEGFGPMEQTIHKGRRWSAANAYLRPALKRKNVSLVNGLARRVVIENHRATGVEIEARGQIQVVKARREVIVAASSINSPKLLMLSGIGPAAHLAEHGIETVADRPGRRRQSAGPSRALHPAGIDVKPITLYSKLNLFSKALIGAEWLFLKSGLGTSNHFEAAAFVRSRAGVDYPDIQYHFLPVAIRYDGKAAARTHGFQAHVGPMRSKSRGAVTLRSGDPREKPMIRFNYMSHEDDWRDFRHAIRLTREIFAQPAFDPFRGAEIAPGAPCPERRRTRRLYPRACRERLPPLRHLPHGPGRRRTQRGRSRMPGHRRRRAARGRFLDLPAHHQRQPQRAVDHGGREGGRPHSGQARRCRPPTRSRGSIRAGRRRIDDRLAR